MMELAMQFSRQPLKEDDLAAFETRNGLQLPKAYRDFLLANNGGSFQFDYPAYRISEHEEPEGLLQCFLCLQQDDVSDIERTWETHKSRLPKGLLPIARDPGGSLLCLGTSGKHAGHILFWDRNKESSRASFKNVYLVAEDFSAFLNGLYPFEE